MSVGRGVAILARFFRRSLALRRIADILMATIGILVTAPILLALAGFVTITLGRPIIFGQQRVGMNGRPFRLVKFRSMSNSRDAFGRLLSDEERTSALGRLFRRSRFDELPELWNILRGDMSFLGPRPLLPETILDMGELGERRCCIRPGLTGWAQICGNSSLTNDQKISLDLWYIDNRSFRLDLFILIKSIQLIVCGERIDFKRLDLARSKRTKNTAD